MITVTILPRRGKWWDLPYHMKKANAISNNDVIVYVYRRRKKKNPSFINRVFRRRYVPFESF